MLHGPTLQTLLALMYLVYKYFRLAIGFWLKYSTLPKREQIRYGSKEQGILSTQLIIFNQIVIIFIAYLDYLGQCPQNANLLDYSIVWMAFKYGST